MPTSYEEALAKIQSRQSGTATVYATSDANPEEEAGLRALSKKTGIPVEALRLKENKTEAERTVKVNEYEEAVKRNPRLAQWMADPNNASIAQDDSKNLGAMETVLRTAKTGVRSLGRFPGDIESALGAVGETMALGFAHLIDPLVSGGEGVPVVVPGLETLRQAKAIFAGDQEAYKTATGRVNTFKDLLPENPLRRIAAGMRAQRIGGEKFAEKIQGPIAPDAGVVERNIYNAATSFGQQLPTLALTIATKNPAYALGGAGVLSGGRSAGQALEKGASPGVAFAYGSADALAEVTFERFGVNRLLKDISAKSGFAKTLVNQIIREVPSEMATTVAQQFNEWAVMNPDKTLDQFVQELGPAQRDTVLSTVFQSILTAGLGTGVQRIANRAEKAKAGGNLETSLNAIDALATESKLKQRDAETFRDFSKEALKDSDLKELWIDPEALNQSGVADKIIQASPSVASQIAEANVTGTPIRIPMDEYLANIAGSEFSQSVIKYFREDPDLMSPAESEVAMKQIGDEIQSEIDSATPEVSTQAEYKASRDRLQDRIAKELDDLGRFTPQKNRVDAMLIAARSAVRGQQLGMSAEEFFDKHVLKFATGREEQALEQSSREEAEFFRGLGIEAGTVTDNQIDAVRQKYGWTVKEEKNGLPVWGNSQVSLQNPRDVTDSVDVFYMAHGNERVVKYDIADAGGSNVGYVALEMDGDWPTRLIDIEVQEKYRGKGAAENVVTSILSDVGEIGIWSIVPSARTFWERIGTRTVDETNGAISLEDNVVARAGRPVQKSDAESLAQRTRGAYAPGSDVISILDNADLSTVIHESAHYFFETDLRIARDLLQKGELTAGEQKIVDDVQKVTKWLSEADHKSKIRQILANVEASEERASKDKSYAESAKNRRAAYEWFSGKSQEEAAQIVASWGESVPEQYRFAILEPYHEQLAESFERYIIEGKAPSLELQPFFQTMREWMLKVYRSVRDFLFNYPEAANLSDDVRHVFDRMLATDEEIADARKAREMLAMFDEKNRGGMTDAEFVEYQSMNERDEAEAKEELQAKSIKDMKWLEGAKNKALKSLQAQAKEARAGIRAEVESEVSQQPVYRAINFIKRGEIVSDGELIKAEKGHKINLDDLKAMYPESMLARPDIDSLTRQKMADKNGLHPDVLAPMFGYNSGDEMVRAILEARPFSEVVKEETDSRMMQSYATLATDEAIDRAADMAIHNTVRARFVRMESKALDKASGKPSLLAKAAKELARSIVSRQIVGKLRPNQFANAAAKSGKASMEAFKKGDLTRAAQEKRKQVVNTYTTRYAYEAQDEIRDTQAFFKKVLSGKDSDIAKRRDMDYVKAARAVLASIGYGVRAQSAVSYIENIRNYNEELYEVLRDRLMAAEAAAKPFDELTVEELRGFRAEVESLWELSRNDKVIEIDGVRMERAEVAGYLESQMKKYGIPENVPGQASAPTQKERAVMGLNTGRSWLRRVESWAGAMDLGQSMGWFRKAIVQPIMDASDQKKEASIKYQKAFRDALQMIAHTLKKETIAAPELGYTFGQDTGGQAVLEIAHAILHTGNESNKRKLLLGRGWATELPDGTLDTSKWDSFVSRMVREGKIHPVHFDFAQRIWDLMEEIKPLAQKAHREAFGMYFDEVTAQEFVDPFGNVRRGGYVPAKVDARIVQDQQLKQLIEAGKDSISNAFPAARSGFAKSRTEYNRPLLLDLRVLSQHIDEVLNFSYLHNPVQQVARLIRTDVVSSNLNKINSSWINTMLTPWLNRTVKQQISTPAYGSRPINWLRNTTGAAYMMGNISNAAQQVTGFLLAMTSGRVKASSLLKAVSQKVTSKDFSEHVTELSPYMKNRMEGEIHAIRGEMEKILINPNVYQSGKEFVAKHAYFLQQFVDNQMSPIIWTAAFNEAQESGQSEKDAIRIADSVVRETQGASRPEDVARVEALNAYGRFFMQFAGYFNMQANLLGSRYVETTRSELGIAQKTARLFYISLIGLYGTAIIAEAIAMAFRGGPEDDEKDGYLDDWLSHLLIYAPIRNVTAMIPGVGQIINAAVSRLNDNPMDDRMSLSPSVAFAESGLNAFSYVMKKAEGEDINARRAAKDAAAFLSLAISPVAYPLARPISYQLGVEEGTIVPESEADYLRGLMTGTPSPESKRK